MKGVTTLFEHADHSWRVVARDPARKPWLIDTNEFVVQSAGVALITDPGGQEIFPAVFSALSAELDPRRVKSIFASHPGAAAISSLGLWLAFNPEIRCYASWLWSQVITHVGGDHETIIALPDEGGTISLGQLTLHAVPAHHLHASASFHLYDPVARILFTGDVGTALLPASRPGLFVDDFRSHIRYAEAFHRRAMGSNEAKNEWCDRISRLQVDMLCPQHGAIYRGADVGRFVDWFRALPVGMQTRSAT
jgi:flavorubredoxin